MKQFVRVGGAFFTQDDNGTLNYVSEPETLRGLKTGTLPYKSESTSRGLTFGGGADTSKPLSFGGGQQQSPAEQQGNTQSLNSGGTESSAPTDLNSLFKTKFLDTMKNLTTLEGRKANLQSQQTNAPELDRTGYSPSVINNADKLRGEEYSGALKNTTGAVADTLQAMSYMASLADKLSPDSAKKTSDILEYEYRHNLTPEQQKEWDAYRATQKAQGVNTNVISDNERALMTTFTNNPIVKTYNEVVSQKNYMDNVISNGVGGPADLALVFSFMKGLDPNSVVRETEYAMAAKSGNIFAGWAAKFNGYLSENGGFLPANVRTEFQNLVNQKLKAQTASYDNYARSIKEIAKRQGLNPDNVVPRFDLAVGQDKQSVKLTSPDGKMEVNTLDLTPAELQEAKAAGWK